MMAGAVVAVAIGVFAVFAGGAAIGMVIAVAVAVHREDRRMTLKSNAPDWLSGGARRLNGVGVRNEAEPEEREDKELILR
jgi:hypothetical protein